MNKFRVLSFIFCFACAMLLVIPYAYAIVTKLKFEWVNRLLDISQVFAGSWIPFGSKYNLQIQANSQGQIVTIGYIHRSQRWDWWFGLPFPWWYTSNTSSGPNDQYVTPADNQYPSTVTFWHAEEDQWTSHIDQNTGSHRWRAEYEASAPFADSASKNSDWDYYDVYP